MTSKDTIIIIIVLIWLLATLVTGLLALIFKNKFKKFKQASSLLKKQFEEQKKDFKLKETQIKFTLPKDEKCYFFESNMTLHKVKLKDKKTTNNYKKDLKDANLKCSIYITNKRAMIQLKENYFQYSLKNIIYCNYLLVYIKKEWRNSLQLEINDDKYSILIDNFSLMLNVKELEKKER